MTKPPLLTSIPSLHAFDSQASTWQSYRDRIQFYFKANRITNAEEKKALFLWSVGNVTYHLLENLISPQSLTSEDTQFDDLIRLLDAHYDDTKNIMTSTYDFYSCYQKVGQSFSEWKAELCEKLRHCGFTTSSLKDKPQDRALRDMYVIGIRNPKIRQALLKEQDPNLEKTEKIIQVAERLQEDVRHFDSSRPHEQGTVAKIHHNQHKPQQQKRQRNKSPTTNNREPCETCGSTQHPRSQCKYRKYTCNFCQKTGHLERVCRQQQDDKATTNHITTVFKLNNTRQPPQVDSPSATVSLLMNGHSFTFELDTGSTNTVISVKDWKMIGSPPIRSSNYKLECYSGTSLTIKGECTVHVEHGNQVFKLSTIVARNASTSLLGLDWIKRLRLDLNGIVYGPKSVNYHINKIFSRLKPQATVNKSRIVLNKEIEERSEVQAHVEHNPQRNSECFNPHSTSYEYLPYLDDEDQPSLHDSIDSLRSTTNNLDTGQKDLRNYHRKSTVLTRNLGSMLFQVQRADDKILKSHQNQLRARHQSSDQPLELEFSSDDLLKNSTKPTPVKLPEYQSPRYPRYPPQIRKPPDRYTS